MTNTNPMAIALRTLKAGPALIKFRQKTSQQMPVESGREKRIEVVEEHIQMQASSWSEIGETGIFRLSIGPKMDAFVAAEDIFMVLAESSGLG